MLEIVISAILAAGFAVTVWFGWGLIANVQEMRLRMAERAEAAKAQPQDVVLPDAAEFEDTDV